MTRKYVFGPVASRRLGVSLGVDLVPVKTCSLDCVYCEAKRTTRLTLERREYVPVDAVIAELDRVLAPAPELDYITFSGSGEPTLNTGIGTVVDFLKSRYGKYPICLLTNGFALGNNDLRREIASIDRIIPSLDASTPEEFAVINRPAPGLDFERFVEDLIDFTHHSKARIDLELFIVPDVNDSDESIRRFVEIIRRMRLDRVQLNTLDRPGVVDWIRPSAPENTRRFIAALEPFVPVEAVGPFRYRTRSTGRMPDGATQQLLELIRRRPATVKDLELALAMPAKEIVPLLETLLKFGEITAERQERGIFYAVPESLRNEKQMP